MAFNEINPNVSANTYGLDWSLIKIVIPGYPSEIIGCTKIDYSDTREITRNYGIGSTPISSGNGNYSATGTITLYADEVFKLSKTAVGNYVQNIQEFDVHVIWEDTTIDILRNCRWNTNSRMTAQGDTKVEVEINLNPTHISWNV